MMEEYVFSQQELERLRRASDVTEIQMLMAKYVSLMSQMQAAKAYELFAEVEDAEIELAECGAYVGPDHVKAFLQAYDDYLKDPSDKQGWMEIQTLCNPTILTSKDHQRAEGYWTIVAPSARWALPYPCDQKKLTGYWGCGKYYGKFVHTEDGWKIRSLKLVWFLRSPYELGWLKQADCVHMPVFTNIKPDREPDYYNVFNADYGCAYGGIEWGPYLPDEVE